MVPTTATFGQDIVVVKPHQGQFEHDFLKWLEDIEDEEKENEGILNRAVLTAEQDAALEYERRTKAIAPKQAVPKSSQAKQTTPSRGVLTSTPTPSTPKPSESAPSGAIVNTTTTMQRLPKARKVAIQEAVTLPTWSPEAPRSQPQEQQQQSQNQSQNQSDCFPDSDSVYSYRPSPNGQVIEFSEPESDPGEEEPEEVIKARQIQVLDLTLRDVSQKLGRSTANPLDLRANIDDDNFCEEEINNIHENARSWITHTNSAGRFEQRKEARRLESFCLLLSRELNVAENKIKLLHWLISICTKSPRRVGIHTHEERQQMWELVSCFRTFDRRLEKQTKQQKTYNRLEKEEEARQRQLDAANTSNEDNLGGGGGGPDMDIINDDDNDADRAAGNPLADDRNLVSALKTLRTFFHQY